MSDETLTFRCPDGKKKILPLYSLSLLCLAFWFFVRLKQELMHYHDILKWIFLILYVISILIISFLVFKSAIDTFSKLTITPQYIQYEGPLKNITIHWDKILGAYCFHSGNAFSIIGFEDTITFNINNFNDSERLLEIISTQLTPIFNRVPPSKSEEVLCDLVKQILQTHPNASVHRIIVRLISIDRNLKFEKIKEIVKSVRTPK